jgi:hypothetical protein
MTADFYFQATAGIISECKPFQLGQHTRDGGGLKPACMTAATPPKSPTKILPPLPTLSENGKRVGLGDRSKPRRSHGTASRNPPFGNRWVSCSPEPTGPSPRRWIVPGGNRRFTTGTARASLRSNDHGHTQAGTLADGTHTRAGSCERHSGERGGNGAAVGALLAGTTPIWRDPKHLAKPGLYCRAAKTYEFPGNIEVLRPNHKSP